jgi:hypothetical protein
MANLSEAQIQERIQAPKNRDAIQRCSDEHQRLRFHVEAISKAADLPPVAYNDFVRWVRDILPLDKYEQFKKYMRLPVPTVGISEKAHTELARALEAENQYIKVDFNNPAYTADFEAYRNQLGDTTFWETDGMEAVRTRINSIIIVDLPRQQASERPEPYYYLLEITPENVLDVDFKKDGVAEYVLFYGAGSQRNILYAYDDSCFRVFTRQDSRTEYVMTYEARHSVFDENGRLVSGLGYCPARRFWDELLTSTSTIQAQAPLAKVFGRLDEYIFDFYSLRYYSVYGKWPVIWEYEDSEPKHLNPEYPGIACEKGYFRVPTGDTTISDNDGQTIVHNKARLVECAECKKSRYTGPGSLKRISPPEERGDSDLREPMGFIEPNPEIMKAAQEALDRDEQRIIEMLTGFGGEPTNASARNEKDVEAGFEGKQSYLIKFKENIEAAQKWALDTTGFFRFFVKPESTVDRGTEFYLKSASQLSEEYANGKKAGLPPYMLAPIRELRDETKFRGNDELRQRQRILSHLQPYPDQTDTELQAWLSSWPAGLNAPLLMLRLGFDFYIKRFERENQMSVVDFAKDLSFDAKIERVLERLLEYAAENKGNAPEIAPKPLQLNAPKEQEV